MIACYRKSDNVMRYVRQGKQYFFIVGGGTGNLTKGDDYQEQANILNLSSKNLALNITSLQQGV